MWRLALALVWVSQDAAPISFSDVTAKAGLVKPLDGMMGHGGAWGDFDGDGRVDLFVGGFCDRPTSDIPTRLLRNKGDGTFEPVPQAEIHARTSGAVFADLDNNGTLELFVANNAKDKAKMELQKTRSKLFRNDNGKLVETSFACPLLTARNVGVFDYDADGLLDLLLIEDRFTRSPNSALLRNKGDLQFEDSKLLPPGVFGLGCAVADLNDDRKPDFFVAHSNRLFVSGKDGYAEHSDAFAHKAADGEDWPCGAAFGDLDRDGDFDLVVTAHYKAARNFIFWNEGALKFRREELGTVPIKCPHVEIQDFDNDGWPDIYISVVDGAGRPLVLRNEQGRFKLPELKDLHYFPAGPTSDFDGDGRLDIFLVNWFESRRSTLLRNESPKRRWLQVKVVGKTVNRMGIGSKVTVNGLTQEISIGYGYASGQPAIAHFGLGEKASAHVTVLLPNGKVIEKKDVPADQVLVVEEP
jgi:hypothetical protein